MAKFLETNQVSVRETRLTALGVRSLCLLLEQPADPFNTNAGRNAKVVLRAGRKWVDVIGRSAHEDVPPDYRLHARAHHHGGICDGSFVLGHEKGQGLAGSGVHRENTARGAAHAPNENVHAAIVPYVVLRPKHQGVNTGIEGGTLATTAGNITEQLKDLREVVDFRAAHDTNIHGARPSLPDIFLDGEIAAGHGEGMVGGNRSEEHVAHRGSSVLDRPIIRVGVLVAAKNLPGGAILGAGESWGQEEGS